MRRGVAEACAESDEPGTGRSRDELNGTATITARAARGGDDMTAPGAQGRGSAAWRLAGAGLLAAGVAAALYVAGRLHQPDYTFSLSLIHI